jgi:hypothetical protein
MLGMSGVNMQSRTDIGAVPLVLTLVSTPTPAGKPAWFEWWNLNGMLNGAPGKGSDSPAP